MLGVVNINHFMWELNQLRNLRGKLWLCLVSLVIYKTLALVTILNNKKKNALKAIRDPTHANSSLHFKTLQS